MQLTSENYYSQEANQEYMSVSGYKDFAGTYGKMPCEFYGMEKLNGRWQDEKSTTSWAMQTQKVTITKIRRSRYGTDETKSE